MSETTAAPDRVETACAAWFPTAWPHISEEGKARCREKMARALAAADAASPPPAPEEVRELRSALAFAEDVLEAYACAGKPKACNSTELDDGTCILELSGGCGKFALAGLESVRQALLRSQPEPVASDSLSQSAEPSGVIAEIADERRRQVDVEGWSVEHDDVHADQSLAMAAACYAAPQPIYTGVLPPGGSKGLVPAWPWSREWWKPKNRRRDLIRAAALIVAEIERLDRSASPSDVSQSAERETQASAESEPKWRQGRKVPQNVYVGDEIAGQFQREEWAALAVEAVNALPALKAEVERRIASQESEAASLWKTIDRVTAERDALAKQVEALDALIEQMATALRAHDAYMLNAGYKSPNDDALHPKAAENWQRVRASLAALDAYRKHKDQPHAE